MKTHFAITFPLEPGAAFPVENGIGGYFPTRATSETRKNGIPTRLLTRQEWDTLRGKGGPYLMPPTARRAVPDVDFEAEDGTLHKTAEECLRHDLKARFGVETLDEVAAMMRQADDAANLKEVIEGTQELQSLLSAPKPKRKYTRRASLSDDDKIKLLQSALSQRGLKHCEAAKATGLKSKECKRIAREHPDKFRDKAGKLFNVDPV